MDDVIEFSHTPHAPGVGVLHARYTERKWHVVNSAFGLAVPRDWVGEISYRGKRRTFGAGEVFCTEPGEVHETSRILQPGAFEVILIDERPLAEHLAEVAPHLKSPHFRGIGQRMSPALSRRVEQVVQLIGRKATPLEVQSCTLELVASMADELLDDPRPTCPAREAGRAVVRARECLHETNERWVDLDTLALEAGISRFHLLRSFKRKYGLPPHAYQVGLRVAKAQRLLRHGMALARVASECGFTDQSHLTRHFKQALGVTPGRFARDVTRKQ